MTLAAFICALLCFASLGCATDAHGQRRFGVRPSATRKRLMRLGAWTMLLLSFVLTVAARGWVFGPVVWSGLVMLAAGIVFLILNFVPAPERTS